MILMNKIQNFQVVEINSNFNPSIQHVKQNITFWEVYIYESESNILRIIHMCNKRLVNHDSSDFISFWYNIIAFIIFQFFSSFTFFCVSYYNHILDLLFCCNDIFSFVCCMWFNIVVKSSDNVILIDKMMMIWGNVETKEEKDGIWPEEYAI